QKILARLKKVGSKVVGAVKRGAGRVMHALGNTKVGQVVKRGYETVRNTVNKGKARVEQWERDREAKKNAGKTPEQIAKEKQDKLQKAVNGIRPKVEALLRWGVPKAVLKGALATMRLGYGLTSLGLQAEDSKRTQIMAKVNPEDVVSQVVEADHVTILSLVHQLGQEVLKDPEVQKMIADAEKQKKAGGGTEDNPLVFGPGAGNYAAMGYLRKHVSTRSPGSVEHIETAGFGTSSREQQGRYGRLGSIKVLDVGRYPEIAQQIATLKSATGSSDQQIILSLAAVSQGKPLPGPFTKGKTPEQVEEYKSTFAALHRLLVVEGARNDSAISYNAMLADMVGNNKLSLDTAFSGIPESERGGGSYPPSQVGASPGGRGVAKQIGHPLPETVETTNKCDREEQLQRQIDFVSDWIRMKMETAHIKFETEDAVRDYIKKNFERDLRLSIKRFYVNSSAKK
ncbi:MAG: hypothetical protein H0U76_02560, partial [Ktedonobacteraceae bacterium]|nr:hypothetical protein [Ktedonobacteraceae bacterium]